MTHCGYSPDDIITAGRTNWCRRCEEINTMKGITLRQDEVKQLQSEGAVTIWRDVVTKKTRTPFTGGMLGYGHVKDHLTHGLKNGAVKCPYATPGEVRFVRETLWISECGKYYALRPHFTGYEANKMLVAAIEQKTLVVATGYTLESAYGQKWRFTMRFDQHQATFCNKKPSTHMPAWASRYTVKCTAVIVEKRGEVWQWGIELKQVTQ